MDRLTQEIDDYKRKKERITTEARQRAALFLACGIDIPEALSASAMERERITVRLQRLIERERIKGSRRHWSYDINRHIALKQALDRVRRGE
ncbi:MAG: cytoplasmic protein [Hyphomicrobiales bacterium]|nr:cytoplasmic protein [Hyphomicrobiales bacterium]